jgi:hypothetical protein
MEVPSGTCPTYPTTRERLCVRRLLYSPAIGAQSAGAKRDGKEGNYARESRIEEAL